VVGKHGNQPVGVVLLKDHRLAICSMQVDDPLFARLPKISFSGGPFSLRSFLRGCSVDFENNMVCSEEDMRHLPERLRRLFIHLATKPIPECRPAAPYDGTKDTLSIKGAESVAGKAFSIAIKTAKPVDKSGFADRWAGGALAFVMGEQADLSLLTEAGAVHLRVLRDRNLHRTRADLVAEARAIEEQLEVEQQRTRELAEQRREEDRPYMDARRATLSAFQTARAQALNGVATNLKPFSQRLIKGLVLANIAGARLPIGPLSDAVAAGLAVRYGKAFLFMQDTEVVALGRVTPELRQLKDGVQGIGIFAFYDPNGAILEHPRIILKADIVCIDPRTIFHEIQHARQHTASEETIRALQPANTYETETIEWKAKQAEADFINEFGILY
jgi:hypothetical protein